MIGSIIKLDFVTCPDSVTGVPVTRLSDDIGQTYHPYFTMPLVSRDGNELLVGSDRTGCWQLYVMDLKKQQMVQVTDEAGVDPHKSLLDAANHRVFFVSGRAVKSVDLDTLHTQEHIAFPFEQTVVGQLSITDDGRYLAFSIREDRQDIIAPGRTEHKANIDTAMRERLYCRPLCKVLRVDTQLGLYQVIWGEREWISHTNISPVDADLVLFCHETSWHLVQRMWTMRISTDEIEPLIQQRYNLDRIGHEFFTATGRVGAQFSTRHSPKVRFYLHGDVFVDADGRNEKRYLYPYAGANHIQLNHSETFGVGDHAQIRLDQPDYRDYIALTQYDEETCRVRVGLLCRHGTSWDGQMTHPHPFFMPDDRHVVFSSQTNGRTNVYMAEANWDKTIKNQ